SSCSPIAAAVSCRSAPSTAARASTYPRACAFASSAKRTASSRSRWSQAVQRNPQLNAQGELQHLLSIEGLPREILGQILDTAESFVGVTEREVKKVPLLRGKSVFNLFFEPSTRTRTTFEIAAKRLSADVINLNIALSSQTTGESLRHTVAIIGDILHSRVARSLIQGLTTLGAPQVRVIAPQTLLPTGVEALGVKVFHDMRAGLRDCDVVVMLRLQNERMKGALLPSAQEYFKNYGLTAEKLAL